MREPQRGEVWWAETPEAGRRPYLVLARSAAIPVLTAILAAPVTRTIRGIPSEVVLGPEDGMPVESVAAFDNLLTVNKANLIGRITSLGPEGLAAMCAALHAATEC